MSMKNSSDTIGNRNRDLSSCSAVPQPTALQRDLIIKVKINQSRYRPGVAQRFQEVKVPRVHDDGTGR